MKINLEENNSTSAILKQIKSNSKILEFGAGNGRMTKYLKEKLNCNIDIIELNEDLGKNAIEYANKSFLGVLNGNIENYYWTSLNEKYDYILFADVLQCLHNPINVLKESKKLLKDNGNIIIAVPNISYNGIIGSLLQERWNYTKQGLLDESHIRFFSLFSLQKLIKDCELSVEKENNLLNEVEYSEFKNDMQELPSILVNLLKKRQYGEVYQFVWSLKKKETELSICIPVYNKYLFTKSALNDLLQLDNKKVEIIICNNGSTDETSLSLKELEEKHSNLFVINLDKNYGFGYACNKAYQHSFGKNILFLNNDIRVQKDHSNWFEEFIQSFDDNSLISPTGGYIDPKDNFNFKYETEDKSQEINYLSGWCLGGKREVFQKLILNNEFGPFDAKNFFVFYEDTDLSFRAREKGINLKLVPVPISHFKHQTAKTINMSSLYQDSRKVFLKKWKNKLK